MLTFLMMHVTGMSKEDVRLSTAASSRGNMHGTHTPTISVADSHGNNDFYNDGA